MARHFSHTAETENWNEAWAQSLRGLMPTYGVNAWLFCNTCSIVLRWRKGIPLTRRGTDRLASQITFPDWSRTGFKGTGHRPRAHRGQSRQGPPYRITHGFSVARSILGGSLYPGCPFKSQPGPCEICTGDHGASRACLYGAPLRLQDPRINGTIWTDIWCKQLTWSVNVECRSIASKAQ